MDEYPVFEFDRDSAVESINRCHVFLLEDAELDLHLLETGDEKDLLTVALETELNTDGATTVSLDLGTEPIDHEYYMQSLSSGHMVLFRQLDIGDYLNMAQAEHCRMDAEEAALDGLPSFVIFKIVGPGASI